MDSNYNLMGKLFLWGAAGFFGTLIVIFAAMQSADARMFFSRTLLASREAFGELFHAGNYGDLAAEIPLDGIDVKNTPAYYSATTSVAAGNVPPQNLPAKKNKNPATVSAGKISAKNTATAVSAPPGASAEIVVSEVMAGSTSSPSYEFIELVNRGNAAMDLTGWSIKKKAASGAESTLVSAKYFSGKTILAGGHFLAANSAGWSGSPPPDILWPASYSLSYTSNTVTLYAPDGTVKDSVAWTSIPPGKSYARDPESGSTFVIENVPTPQSSGE